MTLHTYSHTLTCVVEEGVNKGAVFKRGAHGGDVFEVAVEERRVDEGDGFELHADEPGGREGARESKEINAHVEKTVGHHPVKQWITG